MKNRSLTNYIPSYESAREFLKILQGTRYSSYSQMMSDIMAHAGSQQSQVNWKNPDEWIPERLEGNSKDLALRLWQESGELVNPRHSLETRTFANIHGLAQFVEDEIEVTEKGQQLLSESSDLMRSVDEYEGLLFVLQQIVENGPIRRLDLIDAFETFCRTHTTWNAASSIDLALSARVRHLKERKLIERVGHAYQITDAGLKYFRQIAPPGSPGQASLSLSDMAKKASNSARKDLKEYVKKMNPFAFEYLVKRLLEAMGYEDVEVTPASNDKGVDVVADIQLGISRVREVVQVKRVRNNIGIRILNELRGSLPLFGAVRGSIITTSGFTKQATSIAIVPNVAQITLIDGETLLDLLIEHDIGVRRREIKVIEFDEESLSQIDVEVDTDLPVETQV